MDEIDVELQDFMINKVIGTGAYGKVYSARLSYKGDKFAIKVVDKASFN